MEAPALLLPSAFPPTLSADGSHDGAAAVDSKPGAGSEESILRNWCDALLELLASVRRGPTPEAPPAEEVWHWLAAHERLSRSMSFVDHDTANELVCRVAESPSEECAENLKRWRTAVVQLRQLHKEAKWNADYLRVVEEPLGQLSSDDSLLEGRLPRTVKLLMRSLNRIYVTSSYFREQRMATLLHKVLKVLIGQTGHWLVSPLHVARPRRGFAASLQVAGDLRDSFQAFIDGYFLSEAAGGSRSSADRRPATALGLQADRTMLTSGTALKRSTTGDLGWWKATVKTSLEHAEHCRAVCHRLAPLLEGCRCLIAARPLLQTVDAGLLRDLEGFLELHGGVRAFPGGMLGLLDLRHRAEALVTIQSTEEKLQSLLKRASRAGLDLEAVADAAEDLEALDAELEALESEPEEANGGPEVLVLDSSGGAELLLSSSPSAVGANLQDEADAISQQLRHFGAEIDNISAALSKRNSSANGETRFVPPSRARTAPGAEEEADYKVAADLAKRSSWYREPPSLLPNDVELIEVRQDIQWRCIDNCDRRPRTSQPVLSATRPPPVEESPEEDAVATSPSAADGAEEDDTPSPAATPPRPGTPAGGSDEPDTANVEDDDCEVIAPPADNSDNGADDNVDLSSPCGSTAISWRIS